MSINNDSVAAMYQVISRLVEWKNSGRPGAYEAWKIVSEWDRMRGSCKKVFGEDEKES